MSSDDYVDDYDMWADEPDDPDMYDKCPKCGGKLVKRSGRYGEFYGCENFPNCKFSCDKHQADTGVKREQPKATRAEDDKDVVTLSVDNPGFALLVLKLEHIRRRNYVWKGKDRTYPIAQMTNEHLESTIKMLIQAIEERDMILENKGDVP